MDIRKTNKYENLKTIAGVDEQNLYVFPEGPSDTTNTIGQYEPSGYSISSMSTSSILVLVLSIVSFMNKNVKCV